MPEAVQRLLSIFEIFSINISGIGLPLQCLSLGTYSQQMVFMVLAPLVLAGGVVMFFLTRSCVHSPRWPKVALRRGLLGALPWMLLLFYLAFPSVSSLARAACCNQQPLCSW